MDVYTIRNLILKLDIFYTQQGSPLSLGICDWKCFKGIPC